ncbi:hypothetical protein BpHYR1_006921 [Brachionus plicatilis]|uniref:Uncharacterized protein n=1 Tax=Brachionus plicatilis TaxID=10195 RepID=A0A3M7QS93_BRAPC|nr:hypothetical protein BpHYR1_006921 [Brachionus plicatilis]
MTQSGPNISITQLNKPIRDFSGKKIKNKTNHNSAVSRSQAQDEKRGGWWQPHYVVFYESEEELYYGYIDLWVFVLVLSYEGAAGFDQHPV